jgi:hypothetical protein
MSGEMPSRLIQPKFVALDSSHLGAVAADKATNDRTRLRRAEAFEKTFDESGGVLLLCWHHLQELFSHGREDIVAQRVAYLQSLPMVAAVASFQKEDVNLLGGQCWTRRALPCARYCRWITPHVFADGDYVIIHSHAIREPGTRGAAIVDIFRLEDRKIVEHWDIIQPIPDTAANSNGMF